MNNLSLPKIIDFLKFTIQFQQTKRHIFAVGEDRNENDAEHSYQLSMLVWYMIQKFELKLDLNLAIKYAMVHDLEEAITGDIDIFNIAGRANKEKLEAAAQEKINQMFPDWNDFDNLSKSYKLLIDEESRFVNGLDKIIPVVNLFLDGGRTWKSENMTLSILTENKRKKVKVHPITKLLWDEIEKILKKDELKLFGKK